MKINQSLFKGIVIALTYACMAFLTLKYFSSNGFVSIFWLPSGLALAVLLILGLRFWPAIFAGAIICNIAVLHNWIIVVMIAAGNSLEAVAACYLINKFMEQPKSLTSLKDLMIFSSIAIFICFINALIGTSILLYFNQIELKLYLLNLLNWWQGDLFGVMFLTPILIQLRYKMLTKITKVSIAEFLCLLFVTIMTSYIFFLLPSNHIHQYSYILFTIATWSAIRFQLQGFFIILTIFITTGLIGILNSTGSFTNVDLTHSLLHFWFFILFISSSGYFIAISVSQIISKKNELIKNKKFSHLVLNSSKIGIYDIDIPSKTITFNSTYWQMLGYKNHIIKTSLTEWYSSIHYKDRSNVIETLTNDDLSLKKDFQLEYRIQKNNGSWCWLKSTGTCLFNNDNETHHHIIGTHEDITSLKQIINDANDNSKRFHTLVNNTNGIVWGSEDISMQFSYVSNKAKNLCGFKLSQWLKPKFWQNQLHPDDYQRVTKLLSQMSATKQAFDFEFRFLTKSQEIIWLRNMSSIYTSEEGNDFYSGIMIDITEQKQTELNLIESKSRYKALIDNIPFCIHEINMEGNLISMNRGGLDMINLENEAEIVGVKYTSFPTDNEQAKVNELLKKALQGETSFFEFSAQDGKTLLSTCFIPLINEEKQVYRLMGYTQDITEKRHTEKIIWDQANFDFLTKLANRNNLTKKLDQQIYLLKSKGQHFTLMLIDLDKFKEVNDSMGHLVGDQLLIQVSERLIKCVSKQMLLARLGGDEFCVLIYNKQNKSILDQVASEIISSLNQPFLINDELIFITASIGITHSNNVRNVSEVLKFADLALYEAKKQGKNQYCYFKQSLQKTFNFKNKITRELRTAINNNEFVLHFQPIINLNSNTVDKAEVLIRWSHPKLGLIKPNDFISIAEESGQIIEIGYYVMEQSLKQLKKWQIKYNNNFQLSINKSPVEFSNTKRVLIDDCLFLLDKYKLTPQSMNIEITENVLLEMPEEVVNIILSIQKAKIDISLDDFGTGYSSLAYLNRLDIDYLKIDKSFIDNITTNNDDRLLCKAIINMAHTLGLKVVAEGIEHQQQCDLLKSLKCDYGQGYLFSKPILAEEFEKLYF